MLVSENLPPAECTKCCSSESLQLLFGTPLAFVAGTVGFIAGGGTPWNLDTACLSTSEGFMEGKVLYQSPFGLVDLPKFVVNT